MLRTGSIAQLVVIGFTLVTVPLLAAFLATAWYVSELNRTGREAIVQAAEVIQESRVLVEQAAAMERNGRQYLVLDDPTVFELYSQRRDHLQRAVSALRALVLTDLQQRLLGQLEKRESALFRRLKGDEKLSVKSAEAIASELSALTSLARGIMGETGQLINENIAALHHSADQVHGLLLIETFAVVPFAVILGGVFVYLIIRPIRMLGSAIHRLGAGRFDEEVLIQGPRDLQELGGQLDWMRRRLIELEQQKELFLRNISHELKTPLATLREGAQLLSEEVVGGLTPEQKEITVLLRDNSLLLQQMIEDLLQFGTTQTADLHLERRPIALGELIGKPLANNSWLHGPRDCRWRRSCCQFLLKGTG